MGSEKNTPSKEYFINLLTKDIELEDAICEFINQAVDRYNSQMSELSLPEFWINIEIKNNLIQVWDNCGAVEDVDLFSEKLKFSQASYTDDSLLIALLKCGDKIELELNNDEDSYNIKFNTKNSINSWKIINEESFTSDKPKGTRIIIKDLYEEVKSKLQSGPFMRKLANKLAFKYRHLLNDKFKIILKGKSLEPEFIEGESIKEESSVIDGFTVRVKIYKCNKDRINGWDIIVNDISRVEQEKSSLTNWYSLRKDGHTYSRFRGEVFIYSNDPKQIITNSVRNTIDFNSFTFNKIKDFMCLVALDNGNNFKKNYIYIQYEKPEAEVNILKEFFRLDIDKNRRMTAKIVGEESFELAFKEYQKKL